MEEIEQLPDNYIYMTNNRDVYARLILANYFAEYYEIGVMPTGEFLVAYNDSSIDVAKSIMARRGMSL